MDETYPKKMPGTVLELLKAVMATKAGTYNRLMISSYSKVEAKISTQFEELKNHSDANSVKKTTTEKI